MGKHDVVVGRLCNVAPPSGKAPGSCSISMILIAFDDANMYFSNPSGLTGSCPQSTSVDFFPRWNHDLTPYIQPDQRSKDLCPHSCICVGDVPPKAVSTQKLFRARGDIMTRLGARVKHPSTLPRNRAPASRIGLSSPTRERGAPDRSHPWLTGSLKEEIPFPNDLDNATSTGSIELYSLCSVPQRRTKISRS